MKLEELLYLIPKKTGNNINQSILAESLGITRQTVSNRIKNSSQVTVQELKKIEEFFKVILFTENNTSKDDIIEIKHYRDNSSDSNTLKISKHIIPNYQNCKNYVVMNGIGDGMSPTINKEDLLIIELWQDEQIKDNCIYIFKFNNEIFIKRLSKNLDEIIIKSDNQEYRTKTIAGNALSELELIGEVIFSLKKLV